MKRDFPSWFVSLAVIAIVAPVIPAQSKSMIIGVCGGGRAQSVALALDPSIPTEKDKRDACRKACHAGSDRRNRSNGTVIPCC
jgi:hypothetical protein